MKQMAELDDDGRVVNIVATGNDQVDTATLVTYTSENPAYIGGDYVGGYFYPEQPYPSWTRHQGEWLPPVPQPTSEGNWLWNEEAQEWQD